MFNTIRNGAVAAIIVGALTAGYNAPAFSASSDINIAQAATTPKAPAGQKPPVAVPSVVGEHEVIAPRVVRSKCDDLTDQGQRDHCFLAEQQSKESQREGKSN